MQTFTTFLTAFDLPFLVPLLALLIIIGSVGGSINWLLSPAKGLMQAAEFGFLPPFFLVKNKYGASMRILIVQALAVTLLCSAIQLMPSVNACYWFLMSLSTALYMLMYGLLFFAALKLGRPTELQTYQMPRGLRTLSCVSGLMGCGLTIGLGFQPPSNGQIENPLFYGFWIGGGLIAMTLPVLLLWLYQQRKKREEFLRQG